MQIMIDHGAEGSTGVTAMFLHTGDKDEALEQLSAAAAALCPRMSHERVLSLVREREALATSIVSDDIAFPHALEPGRDESVVVLGVCAAPLLWSPPDRTVRIVALFAGGERAHLAAMSSIARILRAPGATDALLAARSTDEITALIAKRHAETADRDDTDDPPRANAALLSAATEICAALPYAELAVVADTFCDQRSLRAALASFEGFLLTAAFAEDRAIPAKWVGGLRLPNLDEVTVESEIARVSIVGAFEDRQLLVLVYGERSSDRLSTIKVVAVSHEQSSHLVGGVHHLVAQRVLQLAREIATEGREGKPVGCLFVIGSDDALADYTHQLIVNPFLGYPEEARNILDPSLEETIKEFSKIDGAFVVRPDGTVASAGTYVAVTSSRLDHHPGEGARHATARAITGVTDSVTIAVSESTGRVSVYVNGKRSL